MIEYFVEYLFSVIDYGCLLYFFHYLNYKRIQKYRFLIAVLIISLIQFLSELFSLPRYLVSVKDFVLIFSFLMIYEKERTIRTVLNAVIINALFIFLITLYINVANIIFVDIQLTLDFGIYRIFFTLIMKIVIGIFMYYSLSQLRKLALDISDKSFIITSICLCLSGFFAAYVLQLSENNRDQLFSMVLIEIIVFVLFSFSLTYNMMMKKNYQAELFEKLIKMTESHIEIIAKEQKKTEKLMHDTKNQMIEIDEYIKQDKRNLAHEHMNQWFKAFAYSHEVPLCINIYVDSVLRQHIKEYPMIEFQFKLQIPEHICMNTTDLLSMITMILETSLEVTKHSKEKKYYLELKGNEHELFLFERYTVNESYIEKDNFKESYIKELIHKYDGSLSTVRKNEEITRSFFLIL